MFVKRLNEHKRNNNKAFAFSDSLYTFYKKHSECFVTPYLWNSLNSPYALGGLIGPPPSRLQR